MRLLLRGCVTLVRLLYLSECQFLLLSNEMVDSRSVFLKVCWIMDDIGNNSR